MPQTPTTRAPLSPPIWSINDFDYEPLTPQAPVAPRASAFSLADFDYEPLASPGPVAWGGVRGSTSAPATPAPIALGQATVPTMSALSRLNQLMSPMPASPSVPSFEAWYAEQSRQYGLNPNPDTPEQFYDYRAAFKAGASPDETGHWPSQFKRPGHPNEIVGGFNTRTGERVTGTPQASEAELIQRGWSPADAARMSRPQPTFDPNAAGDFAPPPVWTPVDTKIAETRARVPKVDTAPFNPPRFTGIDMNPADPLFAPPAADRAVQGANYTLGGVKQVGKGLVRAAESGVVMRGGPLPVSSIPHPQETMAAASDIMEGVAAAATPLAVAGMLLNAPVTTGAIGATMLASWASGQAADYAGADPETKRFVQNLASTVAAAGGAKLVWDTISPQVQTGLKAVGKDVRAGVLAAKLEAGATPGQAQARGAVGGVPETTSPAFSEPINPEYHINRPSDLGPLSEAVARTKEMIRTGEAPTPETFPSTIPAPSGSVDALMASLAAEKSPRTPRALEIVNLLAQDGKTGTGPDLWTEARQVQGQRGVADVAPETTPRPVVVGPTYDISEGGHIIPTNAAGLAALARPAAPTPTVETPAPSVATPAPAQPAVEAEVVSASEPAPDKAAIRAEMKRRMQEKGILPAEASFLRQRRSTIQNQIDGAEEWLSAHPRNPLNSGEVDRRRRLLADVRKSLAPIEKRLSEIGGMPEEAVGVAAAAQPAVPASVLADSKTASVVAALRKSAESMGREADELRNPAISQQNVTARRARIASGMAQRGDSLAETQAVLEALASAHEAGTAPTSLEKVTTRATVEALRTRRSFSRPTIHRLFLGDLTKALKGKPNTKQLVSTLDRLSARGSESLVELRGSEEVDTVFEALKLAESKGVKAGSWNLESLKDYRRLALAGIGSVETFERAKRDLEALSGPQEPRESPKARQIAEAERKLIGVKMEGYFPTPKPLAKRLVEAAEIEPGMSVLEPSAGKGNIADAIREAGVTPDVVEQASTLADILELKGYEPKREDFLSIREGEYDRIVMNPPFERGQDIEHVQHAYDLLKPGGRVVAVMSEGPFFRNDKKASAFRDWLDEVDGTSEKLAAGSFTGKEAERQTGVATRLVILDKPGASSQETSNVDTTRRPEPSGAAHVGRPQPAERPRWSPPRARAAAAAQSEADRSTEPPRFAPPTTAQLGADVGARTTTAHDAYVAEVTGYGRQNMLNLLHRGGLKAGDGRSDADLAELLWTHFGQPAAEAQARKAQADSVRFAPLSTRQQAESKATLEERKAERGAQVLNAEQADAVMGAKYAVGEQLAEDTNTSGRTLIDWDFKRNTRRQSVLDALGRKDGSVWQAFVADASPQEIEAVSMLVEDARADLAEHGDVSFTDDPRAAIATLAERVGRLQTERGGQVDLFGEPQAPAPAIPQEQGPLVLPEKPPLPSRTATVAEVDAYADALEAYGAKLSGLDAELKRRPYEMPKAWLEQYHDATYDYQENTNVDALRREAIDNEVSSDNVDKARELLRKGEPLTVEELGKALGVHPDSARSLIDVVQDEGDVRVTFDGTAWRGVPEKAELEPSVITPSQPPPVSADLIARKEAEVRSGKLAADPQAVAARLAGKRLVKRGDSFEWRGTRYRFESVDGDDIFTRQADGNAKRRDPQVIAMIERESGVSFDRSTPSRELAEPTKEPVAPSTLPAIPDIPWEGPKPGSPEFASNEVRRRTLADKDDALYQKKVGLEDKLKKTSRTSKLHDEFKTQLDNEKAAREKVAKEEAESEAAREAEIDNEAQVWAAKGQLFYRRIGETKGKGGTWAPTKGELVTIPEVPGYRFWLSKNPLSNGMNLTEEQSGLSAWNGDNKAEAMTDGVARIIKFKDKLAEIVAQHMVDAPPKPALQNWEKPTKTTRVAKKTAAVPEATAETSTAAETPPNTPVEAASDVEQEVRRVIKTDGMKSGAQIQAAVLKTLHDELAGARHVEQARLDWMNKHSQTEQAWRESHPAPTYPDDANVTREFRAKYSKDVAAHKAAREKHMADTVGPFPYGEEPVITIEIPNDGTFTIKRTVEAINEVMKRVSRSPRKQTWEDLTPAGMAKRGNAMEPRRETGKPTPKPSKFQSFMETGGSGGGSEANVGHFTEDIPVTTGTLATRAIEFPEMVALATELQETPTVVRAFRKPGKVGEFRLTGIRLSAELFTKGNERQLAAVLAHEIGHRLRSLQNFLKGTFTAPDGTVIKNPEIRAELLALSNLWRPWDPAKATPSFAAYRKSSKELYADAVSVLLNNPGYLEQKAPIFYREFFKALDAKPEVKRSYLELLDLMSGAREEVVQRRRERVQAAEALGDVKALDAHRAKIAEREALKNNLWLDLRTEYYDKNTVVNDIVESAKKRGARIPEWNDPRYVLSERNYWGGAMKAAAEEFVQPVRDALEAAGVTWSQLHEAMRYERVAMGDRSEYANPGGYAPEDVTEMLAALRASLSPTQNDVLDQAKKDLRDWAKGVSREAHSVGLLTDALLEQIESNDFYAPFRVVEYIEDSVSWQTYKQKGTLKEIGNVATALVLKTMATIRAIKRQQMLLTVFGAMESYAPAGSIEQAQERWDGKGKAPVPPKAGSNQEIVYYYDRGKLRGKLVDPYVANSLNNLSVGQNWAVIRALSWTNSHWFRPVFTTMNLAFQTTNFARDLLRTWANRPDHTLGQILKSPFILGKFYAKGAPLAFARAFGAGTHPGAMRQRATRDLLAAEKAGILGLSWNDMMRGKDVADTEIEQILGKVGVGPAVPPPTAHGPIATPKALAVGVLDFISALGDFIETLPKAAAIVEYRGAGSIADISPAQRAHIRESVGSPDFRKMGTHTPITNNLFLFSNAFLQGNVADWKIATNQSGPGGRGPGGAGYGPGVGPDGPKTAFGFWWKTMAVNVLPKMAMFAAAYLLWSGGDDDDKDEESWLRSVGRVYRAISEYDMTNFLPIPLGMDAEGNLTYVRLPQSDMGRLIGGLTWKALQFARGDKDAMAAALQVLDYMAGQTPSVAPQLGILADVAQFATGGKVYDPFRGRFLFTEDEAADKNWWRKTKKFIGYEFQEMGGGIVWKFYPGEDRPEAKTTGQKILEAPVVSSIAGRWVKISQAGTGEKLRQAGANVKAEEATTRQDLKAAVNEAIRTYQKMPPPNQTRAEQRKLAKDIVADIPAYQALSKADRAEKIKAVEKRLRMGILRGTADPVTDAILSANSNAQKVAILTEAAKSQTASDFSTWLVKAKIEGVISEDVYTTTRRALKQAPPAGVRR